MTKPLQAAQRCLQSGHLDEATRLFEAALAQHATAAALLGLGDCERRRGRLSEAEAHFRRALQLDPRCAPAAYNLGLTLAQGEQLEGAALAYKQAIMLNPGHVKAHNNLANLFKRQGRLRQALNQYKAGLKVNPDDPNLLFNLGNACRQAGQPRDARQAYLRALSSAPDASPILNNLALVALDQGDTDTARQALQRTLAATPNDPTTLSNLGVLARATGNVQVAVDWFRKALSQAPDDPRVVENLAGALQKADRDAEALALLDQALARQPSAPLLRRAGSLQAAAGADDAARERYRQLAAQAPDDLLAQIPSLAWCPTVWDSRLAIEEYREKLAEGLARLSERKWKLDPDRLPGSGSEPPFNLAFQGGDDRPLREAFARLYRDSLPPIAPPKKPKGPPRAGFLVTAGHEGLFLRSVVANINRFSRELIPIVLCPSSSRDTLAAQVTHPDARVLPLPESYTSAVQAIRSLDLHLMYFHEVGSDSLNYFLPFARLAPVQCASWGIQVTTGIDTMDAYLSSRWLEPEGAHAHYTEQLLLLDTLLKQRDPLTTQPAERSEFGLQDDQHLYLCPHHLGKLVPDFDPVLAQILRGDPQGVVMLIEWPGPAQAQRLLERLAKAMPDVVDRVQVLPHMPVDRYQSLVASADLVLDAFYFSGVNTTYDALSLGKAVVTLPGEYQRGRYTLGCYRQMELGDAIAIDADDYVARALALGTDPNRRRALEAQIRERRDALFDHDRIAGELERTLLQLIAQAPLV